MSGATRTTVSEILKDMYLGPIRDQLNHETLLMHRLEKDEDVVEGSEVVMVLHTGRNVGTLAVPEDGTLPRAGRQGYTRSRFNVPYMYGSIRITGPMLASARTQAGAFANILDSEVKGLVRDFKTDWNRMLFSDGSGRLAVIRAVSGSSPTYVLEVSQLFDGNKQGRGVKHLQVGDRVAFVDYSSATGAVTPFDTNGRYAEITAISKSAKTISVTTTGFHGTAPLAGDFIVKGPDSDTTAASTATSNHRGHVSSVPNDYVESPGLAAIVNGPNGFPINCHFGGTGFTDGEVFAGAASNAGVPADLQNVDSTGTVWNAYVDGNNGSLRDLTPELMQKAFDVAEEDGQVTPSVGICSYGVRRAYVNNEKAEHRYVNEYHLDGGFKAIDFNGTPIVPEKDCHPGTLFFLAEEHLKIARMSDFYWLDKDGAILARDSSRKDAWEASMAYYAILTTERRNAHSAILDIRES